ncbi:MAG: hypothetical protein GC191_01615 [Azospirillum sp.]|nr:hypothetical protein [Azospirillum sp.]
MKTPRLSRALRILAAFLVLALANPALAIGPGGSGSGTPGSVELAAAPQSDLPPIRPMTDSEAQGAGCIAVGTTALGLTYASAPTEMIMLVVGGVVVPSTSSILFLSLFATVGALTCAVGAAMTPFTQWAYEEYGG